MFRNFKKISNFFNNRRISAVINHESVDWANAKPFHEIPGEFFVEFTNFRERKKEF